MESRPGIGNEYLYYLAITSAVGLVTVPYVWFTNLTVGRNVIIIDAFVLCSTTPAFMVLFERIIKRFRSELGDPISPFVGYFLALACGVFAMLPFHSLMVDLSVSPTLFTGRAPFFAALIPACFLYFMALLAIDIGKRREAELKLRADRDRSAFSALAAQMRPHFLFNALNTLEALIDENPTNAKECVRSLAHLYRKVLEGSKSITVRFEQELELVQDFVQIQKYRFGRLQVEWKVSKGIESMKFPPNMLLNLLENAVKHGVESSLESAMIEVTAQEVSPLGQPTGKKTFEVIVKNSVGSAFDEQNSKGFGLYEIRTRLELLYGGRANLRMEASPTTVTVTLTLPAETL